MKLTNLFSRWRDDLPASFVVFLVALPLCLGIAIASGVPPALGLVTGIIGGLVVGFLAGAPLQVSGPAAGLTVLVFDLVQTHGLAGLGIAVLIAGVIQMVAGLAGLGRWFRAVSPSVIHGMLAGIGVLIFASQFHVLVDDKPAGSGLTNLLSIPGAIGKGLFPADGSVHHIAAFVGVAALVSLLAWDRFKPARMKVVPAPLIAVIVGAVLVGLFSLPIARVQIPASFADALQLPTLSLLAVPSIWGAALALAFIASAETLLCAVAVDKLHDGPRAGFDRELFAQGVGNTLCGLVGALPMTGVIVRSSANVHAGGKTRLSAVAHGVWLLVFVAALPFVLAWVPTTALAAILVYTGFKLAHPKQVVALARHGRGEVVIFFATVIGIVGFNLLFGVVLGFALSLGRMLFVLGRDRLRGAASLSVTWQNREQGQARLHIGGVASFLTLPKLADALESMPTTRRLELATEGLHYLDAACLELVETWHSQREPRGGGLVGPKETLRRLNGLIA